MEMASIIISIIALLGSLATYIIHDHKIKEQEKMINEYQLAKYKEEEEENKKALISGNIIKKERGQRVLKIYNKGKATATNINIQGLDIKELDIYDKILPYELLHPQGYTEIRFMLIMEAPSTIRLTYTWDDPHQKGNTLAEILSL